MPLTQKIQNKKKHVYSKGGLCPRRKKNNNIRINMSVEEVPYAPYEKNPTQEETCL